MGAWDTSAFGNDTAADWAWELDDNSDYSIIEETLERVLAVGDDNLDATSGEEALAAAEALARAYGNTGVSNAFTESVDNWVTRLTQKPDASLAKKAHAAIDRIVRVPSELLELWEETDDKDLWKQAVAELKLRIPT